MACCVVGVLGVLRTDPPWREKYTEEYRGQALGAPTSVTTTFSEATVTKHNEGPVLAKGPKQPADFWEFLASWGGEWMWEGIDDSQATKQDLTWLVEGMKTRTLIW